jgi:hypothetical protein
MDQLEIFSAVLEACGPVVFDRMARHIKLQRTGGKIPPEG